MNANLKMNADTQPLLDVVHARKSFTKGDGGELLVNEIAPRVHNSGHWTQDGCEVDQFEQHIRAICGLPLADTTLLRPAAMVNLLEDLWANGEPQWASALEDDNVHLHLYGKAEARPGRKMGHLTVLAQDGVDAARRAVAARDRLTACPTPVH